MEKEEIFRIFDACQPTVAQVKEYLERISKESPFDLIFCKDGKETITKKIAYDLGELIGIVVEKNIFYTKPLTKSDISCLDDITAHDVFAFGKKIHAKALPLNQKTISLIEKHYNDFLQLADMLDVYGYPKVYTQQQFLLIDDFDKNTFGQYYKICSGCDGATLIRYFLKKYGDIYFYASIQ